ncbi:Histidine kinase-, DNA gyrase B-, and HSP90-like ATPase [Pseudomonas sp. NFPP10]|uniref:DAHL domain-containing protein n=1 Tax=unclassified Pseudomonas TaxID=196821 RepID=UPI000880043D|nr:MULTISPECIES: DAHL domain-containing protein [unclassified Pseudomonas]PZP10679.1 MAG: GHKL domain-containing protein [Pseudomonas protegens]SDA11656.1 Histidine kinase-, DNA gyrase B-, and HSP90-like ATPase [Pseudomonas sp. NFPP12]SEK49117.1 Histidine kinase-, DNA gyrase B-, and HSP90-like ATPase [Pseudomonas sp. NFPP10]SEP84981.1 Histidine kinase-, DNA gyrase B-, and HSP90-like ATPase [Pseudomonas sp. NFPP19]SFH93778.1 Histidine kinase-, DNA gyrase B-, and HSP90-like ATPase [Pseudomonas s
MKLSRRLPIMLLSLLTLSLVLGLAFLYFKTVVGQPSNYVLARDLISHIKQLNAQWETEVLKARIAITHDYDPLVMPVQEINQLWNRFDQLSQQNHNDPAAWTAGHQAFIEAFQEKAGLVERFKTHNAVLRNSLAFLPTAEDDIQRRLAGLDDQARLSEQTIAIDTYDLLLSSLEFAQVSSDDRAADILVGLNKLAVNKERLPEPMHEPVEILSNHVSVILREQPVVNELLERITSIPIAQRLDEITHLLNADQSQSDLQDQKAHQYLLLFAALLVILILYLAVRLVRSYAVIRRVNTALQSANEHLEHRVEERTRELKEAQSELMDSARQAGMAEIATNVLHNVGNVLNSVNICSEVLSRTLRSSKAQGLGKAMQLINQHQDDLGRFFTEDDKGKLLPGYLNQLVEAIATEQQGMGEELAQLARSVDHIKEIVATQQSYAGASRLIEPLRVAELIEDALRMNSGALARHQVTVVKDYGPLPPVMGDKHRMLLILINLISNAKYAMSNLDDHSRTLTLSARVLDGQTLSISVKDEGEGIPAENLTRIFSHGFTTRKDGHGFGLHSCALAAMEMGGQLNVHSDGPGLGATFTLDIPLISAEDP